MEVYLIMQLCMTLLIISTPLPFCTNMFSSRSFICVDDPSFVDLYCDNYFSLLKSSIVDLYTHFWFVLDVYLVPSHILSISTSWKWLHVCSFQNNFVFVLDVYLLSSHLFFPFPLHENGFMFVAYQNNFMFVAYENNFMFVAYQNSVFYECSASFACILPYHISSYLQFETMHKQFSLGNLDFHGGFCNVMRFK